MKKSNMAFAAAVFVLLAAFLSETGATAVYAAEGWEADGREWRYLDKNNQPVSDVWRQSKDEWFYLGSDGRLVRDSLIYKESGLYYVDSDGRRVKNSWIWSEGRGEEGFEDGWYFFGSEGKAYRKASGFKRTVNGKAYAFDENGKMLTGWLAEDGRPLAEEGSPQADGSNPQADGSSPLTEGVYYAGEDGALLCDVWLDYGSMQLCAADNLDSSLTGRDYSEYKELWLYFGSDSKKVKSSGENIRQKTIGESAYGFDEYGIMLPWWGQVASISNAERSNPTSSESAKFFAGYDGGKLLKDMWFWMCPSENLDEQDGSDGEYSWWHTDQKGEVYRNRIRKIGGESYAFDGLGRMRTGFVLFDGLGAYVAQYDTGTWSSSAFKNGDIYGQEKADLYLFGPDELNDGTMKTGKDIKVELEDGVYTFGFGSSGIAYGNRNRLRKTNQSFYINGLKLEADTDYKYGVVREEEDSYRVVDTNGKVVAGDKKVLKDKEDGWILLLNGRFAARAMDADKPRWHNGKEGPGFYHYDKNDKEDKYSGGRIVGYGLEPVLDSLPNEEKLNFE